MTVVLLCLGAAKAGTTWLHAQLSRHPACQFRAIKELHYFSALEQGTLGRELAKHKARQSDLLEGLASRGQSPDAEQARRIDDRAAWIDVLDKDARDETAYLAYLQADAKPGQVVADMTPAYALLSEIRLAAMARMAPDVRALFVMRDPIDRLWSHVRMIAARRALDGKVAPERCDRILRRTISGEESQIAKRSDYEGALKKITAAFAPGRRLFDVFEDMVRGPGLDRICAFLGIAPFAGDRTPLHEGAALPMTKAQYAAAFQWLQPQYAAAEAALGHRPESWAKGEMR